MLSYEIRSSNNSIAGAGILKMFFGEIFESVLDRLAHKHDGYIKTIVIDGLSFDIYRLMHVSNDTAGTSKTQKKAA